MMMIRRGGRLLATTTTTVGTATPPPTTTTTTPKWRLHMSLRHVIGMAVLVLVFVQAWIMTTIQMSITLPPPHQQHQQRQELLSSITNSKDSFFHDSNNPNKHPHPLLREDASAASSSSLTNFSVAIVAGLVKNTSQIRTATWKVLADLSCHYQIPILITAAAVGNPHHHNPHVLQRLYSEQHHSDQTTTNITTTTTATTTNAESTASCASFRIQLQDASINAFLQKSNNQQKKHNRIALLGRLRDWQRKQVQQAFFSSSSNNTNTNTNNKGGTAFASVAKNPPSVIILIDLDLIQIPTAPEIVQRIPLLQQQQQQQQNDPNSDNDRPANAVRVLCAMGQVFRYAAGGKPKYTTSYSDTFATVFWPDSFAFPVELRLQRRHYPQENVTISNQSPAQLTKYIEQLAAAAASSSRNHASSSSSSLAPVRSCFSGLAYYQASVWLNPLCQYSLYPDDDDDSGGDQNGQDKNQDRSSSSSSSSSWTFWKNQPRDANGTLTILRYAFKLGKVPCEHVVFHDCLHRLVFHNIGDAAAAVAAPASGGGGGGAMFSPPSPPRHIAIDPTLKTFWRCC